MLRSGIILQLETTLKPKTYVFHRPLCPPISSCMLPTHISTVLMIMPQLRRARQPLRACAASRSSLSGMAGTVVRTGSRLPIRQLMRHPNPNPNPNLCPNPNPSWSSHADVLLQHGHGGVRLGQARGLRGRWRRRRCLRRPHPRVVVRHPGHRLDGGCLRGRAQVLLPRRHRGVHRANPAKQRN